MNKKLFLLLAFASFVSTACQDDFSEWSDKLKDESSKESYTDSDVDGDSDTDGDADMDGDTDTDSDTDADGDWGYCNPGETRCEGSMLQRCDRNGWNFQDYDDCTIKNEICTVINGNHKCVDPYDECEWENCGWWYGDADADADADSDSDSDTDCETGNEICVEEEHCGILSDGIYSCWNTVVCRCVDGISNCDGENIDCYDDCWGCAMGTPQCQEKAEQCLKNDECAQYYTCQRDECCTDGQDCLTGDEWASCIDQCREKSNASGKAIQLYDAITECIACDVCAISCFKNTSDFFQCANPDEVNSLDNPCFAADLITDNQIACFSWAGWGGPCTEATAACKKNSECVDLEACINESWDFNDGGEHKKKCIEEKGGMEGEIYQLYADYTQCIFCDACNISCATDAEFFCSQPIE
ncbi:MAG: hypothetical protein JXR76_05740 [Deltaproteobacteria bacterium]|nr:hypothetical protein [Deltaproteobacteria bacterium]